MRRWIWRIVLAALIIGPAAYFWNQAQTYQQDAARNSSALATAQAQIAQNDREAAARQEQQATELLQPTLTPVFVPVPGPTVVVTLPSEAYSYLCTRTEEDSPSLTKVRASVVVPPGLKSDTLAFRMEGGQDIPIAGSVTIFDLTDKTPVGGFSPYMTLNLVQKSEAGNGPVLGTTGQFQVPYGRTAVIVCTFVPKEAAP